MSLFKRLVQRSIKDFLHKRKNWLIAFFILICTLFGLNFLLNRYIDEVVGRLIKDLVDEKSSGFYHVQYDEIGYIINNGQFRMHGFKFDLHPDHQIKLKDKLLTQNYIYQAEIPVLNIAIIDLWSVFFKKKLRVSGIEIIEPSIKITNLHKSQTPKKITFEAGNLYKMLSEHLLELKINDFTIVDGTFDYMTPDAPDYDNFHVNGLSFKVENFLLNNESPQRDDKFFYTDDISLEIHDQVLLLKDSVHQVEFEKFYVSTRKNELGFRNFRLTRRENTFENKRQRDHYEISLPDLRFSGIDFLSAYNDNFLFIDSIRIEQPAIDLVRRIKNKRLDSDKDNLLDLFMIYHDYLEVGHFVLKDASLKFRDETQPNIIQYAIDQIGATFTEIKIDTGRNTLRPFGLDFNSVDLIVKEYEMLLPDSANTISFAEFSISSNPDIIIVKDLLIEPDSAKVANSEKQKLVAKFPYMVIKGFDIGKYINQDTVQVRELFIEKPEIEVLSANSGEKDNQNMSPNGLFGLYEKVNSFSRLFQIDKIILDSGQFSFANNHQHKYLELNDINLDLAYLKIDSLTSLEEKLIDPVLFHISMGKSRGETNDLILDAEKILFNSSGGSLKIEDLQLHTLAGDRRAASEFYFTDAGLSGINLNDILVHRHIGLDTFLVRDGRALLHVHVDEKSINRQQSIGGNLNQVITINKLIVENTSLEVNLNDSALFKVRNLGLDVSALTLDPSLSPKLKNQFDYRKINKISATDYTMFLPRQNHLLEIRELELTDNATISMKNISLLPVGKPANEYRIAIPGVLMTQMDFKEILNESYYKGSEILIHKPDIFLKLAQGKREPRTSLDLGFIPLLLRNRFSGLEVDTFAIKDATVHFYQKSSTDSLLLEFDRFDLKVHHFMIDSTTKMQPGRFLFSNDVRLNGDYLSVYQPEHGNFYSINHINLSSKDQDIHLEGIYAATNTENRTDSIGQLKLSIDYLNFIDLNFFNLTQRQELALAQIDIANARLNFAPSAQKKMPATGPGNRKSLISDSSILEKSTKMLHDINLFGKSSISPQESKSGFKMYGQKYLFDTMLLKSVRIDQLLITDSRANLENAIERKTDLALPDIWFLAEGISYNPTALLDSTRIFYSDKIMTRLTNLNYALPDNMNVISVSELKLNSQDSTVKIKNFKLTPLVSKYDYGVMRGFQSTWMKLDNDSIVMTKVDFIDILNNKTLNAGNVDLYNLNFEIYRDKRVSFPEWQRRPLPQTELKNIDFTLNIDTINLNNSFIGYLEHAEKSNAAGEVFFNNVNAKIINFTNDSVRIVQSPKTNISASAMVYGKGKVNALFQFDMQNPENIHTYGVEVDSLDLTEFNRILIPNASAQIRSGISQRIVMTAKANEQYSYGEMRFYYNDLKIQLLNPETEMPGGLGKVLGSFFANTFIIRTNNPKNFVVRKGDIFFERDKKRAIFNYWTKTFLSGVVSSIGAANNKKKIENMHEEYLHKSGDEATE